MVTIKDETIRHRLPMLKKLNLVDHDQKMRQDKHTHIRFVSDKIQSGADFSDAIFNPLNSGIKMDVAPFVDQGSGNSIVTEANDSAFDNGLNSILTQNTNATPKRAKDIRLVISKLDHAMETIPEKLRKIDFNLCDSINTESLSLSFGGVERVESLEDHYIRIVK